MNSKEMRQEIEEAMEAGEAALENLKIAREKLENAAKWGMFDILGGGMVVSAVKNSKIKDVLGYVELARIKVRRYF